MHWTGVKGSRFRGENFFGSEHSPLVLLTGRDDVTTKHHHSLAQDINWRGPVQEETSTVQIKKSHYRDKNVF